MNQKKTALLAWLLCGFVGVGVILNLGLNPVGIDGNATIISMVSELFRNVFPLVFAIVGALIASKQPHNAIGWLLMAPALLFVLVSPIENYLESFGSVPPEPTTFTYFLLWIQNWAWLPLIYPIILLPLLFPTGKPPTLRWGKIILAFLILFLIFMFFVTFAGSLGPPDGGWMLQNPIGFIPDQLAELFVLPFVLGFGTLTILCFASLFVRYRSAGIIERNQIKWLLYASGMFAVVYVPALVRGWEESNTDLFNLLFILTIIMIPVSIAIAILRYRLFDIDILIRKTLVYGGLTITLGLLYFGGVILLQSLFEAVSGQGSTVAIVISTLIIAALFIPLRNRIQHDIDRRFYRSKYDAQRTVEGFAISARDETNLNMLTSQLVRVVEDTMQPDSLSVWLPVKEETSPPGEVER